MILIYYVINFSGCWRWEACEENCCNGLGFWLKLKQKWTPAGIYPEMSVNREGKWLWQPGIKEWWR